MPPHFETVKSFADVPIGDEGVDTSDFLEASTGLVDMFDLLGNGVFGFVQNDLRSNIAGVKLRYDAHTDTSRTLEKLVITEAEEGVRVATACLVRLIRGLAFTCHALMNVQADRSAELHVCFKRSYDIVLRHHHSFVIRSVVSLAIRAVPHRQDFYTRIAQGGSVDKLDEEMAKWLVGLDAIVTRVTAFLLEGNYGKV
ncbi:glycolipid transfer protein [Dentipellis sp. KUC8613]|nr:glycolipid transfer protein [Dentipellis sp. KUC8613]